MAYKDSGEIANNSNYALGDYSFRIERTSVPGSTNDKIEAICTDKDGKNARKSIQLPSSTQLDGWYVEANETEATVYATIKVPVGDGPKTSDLDTSPITQPITATGTITRWANNWQNPNYPSSIKTFTGAAFVYGYLGSAGRQCYIETASEMGGQTAKTESFNYITGEPDITTYDYANAQFTHNGKTVYYVAGTSAGQWGEKSSGIDVIIDGDRDLTHAGEIAWTLVYGNSSGDEYETKEIMVGRFAVDIEDAGGDGPGSDWVDPGDYDPDWEEGDPTHTLYVEATGALSGRHNDPIEDPSYSYIPADKNTVKDYGCGGDGGHGGGGGAGASTVVVHKFATNQANSKEVTAIVRRHGYGSGGGKGGKGGDGCILVYY